MKYLGALFIFLLVNVIQAYTQTLQGVITYEVRHEGWKGNYKLGTYDSSEAKPPYLKHLQEEHYKSIEQEVKKRAALVLDSSYTAQSKIYFHGNAFYWVEIMRRRHPLLGSEGYTGYSFYRKTTDSCEFAITSNKNNLLHYPCKFTTDTALYELDSTRTILGMSCKAWRIKYAEREVTYWVTQELELTATPAQHQLSKARGTVLGISDKGRSETIATRIELRPIDKYALLNLPLKELGAETLLLD